jgi:drug/metabolite transporter superfamily protein YnfA
MMLLDVVLLITLRLISNGVLCMCLRLIHRSAWKVYSANYAACGGVFIAVALAWGVDVDGFRPDRWDMLGAAICVAGVVVMVALPRV